MFAVFWRRMGAWTLVKPNAFAERGARCELDAQAAFGMNHMNMLGDVALATRTPLRLKIEAASNNAVTTEDGVVSMVIGAVRLFSRYGEIIENAQKRLALFMMMYGRWRDAEPRLVQDADGVTSIEAEFDRTPEEADPDAYGVGWLSILYSRMFSYYTLSPSGDVRSFRAQPLDGGLQRFVPKNYPFATARLPLLILEIPPSAPLVYREQ